MKLALKSLLQHLYPHGTFRLSHADKSVYLTFDDGPIPEVTPQVLQILRHYNARATFFMVGENIQKHPDIFRMVAQDSHSIGNHTFHHTKGWRCSQAHYLREIQAWEDIFYSTLQNTQSTQNTQNTQNTQPHSIPKTSSLSNSTNYTLNTPILPQKTTSTQYPTRKLFRPPYGKAWLWQRCAVKHRGYDIILWDVLTRDYLPTRSPEDMLQQIKNETRPGSIINFHDSLKSNQRMLEVLPQAIEWLLQQGYQLKQL